MKRERKFTIKEPRPLPVGKDLYVDQGANGPFIIVRDYLGGDLFLYFKAEQLRDWLTEYIAWKESRG